MPAMAWPPLPCTLLGLLVLSLCQSLGRSQEGDCLVQTVSLQVADGVQVLVDAPEGQRQYKTKASARHGTNSARQKDDTGNNTIAKATGVNRNSDSSSTLHAVCVHGTISLAYMGLFSFLRLRYPLIYSSNVLQKRVPFTLDESFLGWVSTGLRLTVDTAAQTAGLDCAMFLEFQHLCVKMLAWLSVPLVLIVWPLEYLRPHYMYDWAQSCAVWYVVLVIEVLIHRAYRKFLSRRAMWWRHLPRPWATTVMVGNIAVEHRSDEELKALFNAAFKREAVERAYVVRRTGDVPRLTSKLQRARERLKESEEVLENTGQRPTNHDTFGTKVDSILFFKDKVKRHEAAAQEALSNFYQALDGGNGRQVMAGVGFVTFHRRTDVMEALKLQLTERDACTILFAPDPENVHYTALMEDAPTCKSLKIVGYSIILTTYLGFAPLLLGIISIMKLAILKQNVPSLSRVTERWPHIEGWWDALVACIVLSQAINCVLAVFAAVIRHCFMLHSESAVQHTLQCWYYSFLVIYVLLVTTLGASVWDVWHKVHDDPYVIFTILATSLPRSSDFYLKFVMLQMTVESLMQTRYLNLLRFFVNLRRHSEARAHVLSEPEDQDWDGIGARCARTSLVAASVLVFCTVRPGICILGLFYFALTRICYGYRIVFAETRKPDLGGVFWTAQLRHLRQGLFLYVVLMVEILRRPEAAHGPSVFAGCSLAVMLCMSFPLKGHDDWEHIEYLDSDGAHTPSPRNPVVYKQPELEGLHDVRGSSAWAT